MVNRAYRHVGICLTCNHFEHCRLRPEERFPVWFCEQFDDYAPADNPGRNPGGESPTPSAIGKKLNGLCVNCELAADCALAKSEGGVWHCEEYR